MLISKRKYYRNFYIAMMVVSLLLFISGLIANNYLFHINVIGKICKYAESCASVSAEFLQSGGKRCEGETRTADTRKI